ncbi:hypothetical protein JCM18899A_00340 [Nocardioides sp. AN3]
MPGEPRRTDSDISDASAARHPGRDALSGPRPAMTRAAARKWSERADFLAADLPVETSSGRPPRGRRLPTGWGPVLTSARPQPGGPAPSRPRLAPPAQADLRPAVIYVSAYARETPSTVLATAIQQD